MQCARPVSTTVEVGKALVAANAGAVRADSTSNGNSRGARTMVRMAHPTRLKREGGLARDRTKALRTARTIAAPKARAVVIVVMFYPPPT